MMLSGKRLAGVAALFALAAWASGAFAAREEQVFEVSVTIPTYEFYVLPVDPGFLEHEQQMHWNLANETLEPLHSEFDVRSASGAITARLGYTPVLSNGSDLIALNVKFNDQLLTLSDTVVVSDNKVLPGSRVPLHIEALKPDAGFKPGDYYGSVQIVFDALAP